MAVFSKLSKNLSCFRKRDSFSRKPWTFSKVAKHRKFTVECDRISKISEKVRKIWAVMEKKMAFQKKTDSSETAEGSKFAVECNWN